MIKTRDDHALMRFWNRAYIHYRESSGLFKVSEMDDPIISPCFDIHKATTHFNAITSLQEDAKEIAGLRIRNSFYLCTIDSIHSREDMSNDYRVDDLSLIGKEAQFWNLLKDGFFKDYEFLQKLMSFLPSLEATFKVGLLMDQGEAFASVVVGLSGDTAVLLSGVIDSRYRNQLFTRELHKLVRNIAFENNIKEIFYWTMEEKLTRYADHTDQYLIYIKS